MPVMWRMNRVNPNPQLSMELLVEASVRQAALSQPPQFCRQT